MAGRLRAQNTGIRERKQGKYEWLIPKTFYRCESEMNQRINILRRFNMNSPEKNERKNRFPFSLIDIGLCWRRTIRLRKVLFVHAHASILCSFSFRKTPKWDRTKKFRRTERRQRRRIRLCHLHKLKFLCCRFFSYLRMYSILRKKIKKSHCF